MTSRVSSFPGFPGLLAAAAVVMWSFSFPASKVVYGYFNAIDIVLLRYLVASAFFAILFLAGKVRGIARADWLRMCVVALVGCTAYQLLFVSGVALVTPAAASMIISTTPIFSALLALAFTGKRLNRLQVLGTLVGFIGVALVCFSRGADGSLQGYLLLILAALAMGSYFILQKPLLEKYSALDLVCYNTWFGCLSLIWHLPRLTESLSPGIPLEGILAIVVMGVFSSGIGFILWFKAIASSSATNVTNFMYLQPLIVGLMAWWWIKEVPSMQAVLGGVVVIASLIISNGNWKRKAQ